MKEGVFRTLTLILAGPGCYRWSHVSGPPSLCDHKALMRITIYQYRITKLNAMFFGVLLLKTFSSVALNHIVVVNP